MIHHDTKNLEIVGYYSSFFDIPWYTQNVHIFSNIVVRKKPHLLAVPNRFQQKPLRFFAPNRPFDVTHAVMSSTAICAMLWYSSRPSWAQQGGPQMFGIWRRLLTQNGTPQRLMDFVCFCHVGSLLKARSELSSEFGCWSKSLLYRTIGFLHLPFNSVYHPKAGTPPDADFGQGYHAQFVAPWLSWSIIEHHKAMVQHKNLGKKLFGLWSYTMWLRVHQKSIAFSSTNHQTRFIIQRNPT